MHVCMHWFFVERSDVEEKKNFRRDNVCSLLLLCIRLQIFRKAKCDFN
jgi:hypothetical protein